MYLLLLPLPPFPSPSPTPPPSCQQHLTLSFFSASPVVVVVVASERVVRLAGGGRGGGASGTRSRRGSLNLHVLEFLVDVDDHPAHSLSVTTQVYEFVRRAWKPISFYWTRFNCLKQDALPFKLMGQPSSICQTTQTSGSSLVRPSRQALAASRSFALASFPVANANALPASSKSQSVLTILRVCLFFFIFFYFF